MSAVEQFTQQCSLLAVRLGIKSLAIAVRDPATNVAQVIASPTAMHDLRDVVAAKFGLMDAGADTEWPA